jgi:hypothetical protein
LKAERERERERERVVRMGILQEDVVVISQAEKPGEPAVITVNCPDKTGLGCDLCRVILLFGLSICREGKFFFFNVFEIINFELL